MPTNFTRWPRTVALLALVMLAMTGRAFAAPAQFVHPGIFTTQADLAKMRARVHNPHDPMAAGAASVFGSKFYNMAFVPKPVAVVTRDHKSVSPQDERDAAMTAYVMALHWSVYGDGASRDKALSIMAAWADVFQTHTGDINRYLDAAWVTTPWSAAGELMLHAKVYGHVAEWPAPDVDKFKAMVRLLSDLSSYMLLHQLNPNSKGGNWEMSAVTAALAAGVFLDDPKTYNLGMESFPRIAQSALTKDGWSNEIFRDAWHGNISLSAAIQAAEIARQQGDPSLYEARFDGQSEPRILLCLKWYAGPLRGIPSAPLPAMGPPSIKALFKPQGWQYDAKSAIRSTGSWEMAYNYYAHIAHDPGLDGVRDMVENDYRPSGQDNAIYLTSDSLTHAGLD